MKKRYFTLPSLLFIIQLISVLPLRAEHYYFKQISLKEGLPSNVRCILRDEQGFVWIGTKSGLGKFDGHELKRYKHQANDPNSLLHNLIYQIAEDKQHNIWVLTEKGIARYQQQSNDFTFPTDEDGKNITAYSFCLVPNGILFGGKDRIYKYSYNDSSLRLLQYFNANSFKINALSMWDSKTLLCCSRWTGIYLVDLHTGEHRRPPFRLRAGNYHHDDRQPEKNMDCPLQRRTSLLFIRRQTTGFVLHPQLRPQQRHRPKPR